MRRIRFILVGGIAFIALWLMIAAAWHACGDHYAMTPHKITHMRKQVDVCNGQAFSDKDLQKIARELPPKFENNQYSCDVSYLSPSMWKIRFFPKQSTAFTWSQPWGSRLLFLDFHRSEFPEMEASGPLNSGDSGRTSK